MERIFRTEIGLFDDIKGISTITVTKALLFSNPKNFPSISKYLRYIGFTEYTSITKNGKRRINPKRTPFYEMCKGVIMKKDGIWYSLYLKVKKDMKKRFPKDRPYQINEKAMNRVSTLLAKEFYRRVNNQKVFQGKLD